MTRELSQKTEADLPIVEFPFAGLLDREELAFLGQRVSWHRISKGDFLWREGDADDRLALIVHGRVELFKEVIPGRPLVLGLFGPGALVGDLSFAGACPRETSAKILEDLMVVQLTREAFDEIARERPALAFRILDELLLKMSDQLRHAYGRLASVF